jgi:hypothetical protein
MILAQGSAKALGATIINADRTGTVSKSIIPMKGSKWESLHGSKNGKEQNLLKSQLIRSMEISVVSQIRQTKLCQACTHISKKKDDGEGTGIVFFVKNGSADVDFDKMVKALKAILSLLY